MQEELLLRAGRLLLAPTLPKPDLLQPAEQIIDERAQNDLFLLERLNRSTKFYEGNFRADLAKRRAGIETVQNKEEDPTDVSRKEFTTIQAVEKSDNDNFIGANALSMSRLKDANADDILDFSYLQNNSSDYLVCAKSDGMRYLLFVCNNRSVYMNDRKNQFFEVNCFVPSLFFASDFNPCDPDSFKIEYIFDGELILNNDEQEKIKLHPDRPFAFQFLAFDTLVYRREGKFFKKYTERLNLIKTFQSKLNFYLKLSQPECEQFLEQNPEVKQLPRVEFILKDFYRCSQIEFLMQAIIKKKLLPHENDGLIFTKINYPYIPGKNRGILKWKPNELNTVDFLLVATDEYARDPNYSSLFTDRLFVFELYTIYGEDFYFVDFLYITDEDKYVELRSSFRSFTRNGCTFEGGIFECSYDHSLTSYEIRNFNDIRFADYSSETLEEILKRCIVKLSAERFGHLPKALEECLVYTVNRKSSEEFASAGGWVVLKQRKDKEFPNNLNTAFNTIKAIFDSNISEEELLEAFRPSPENPPQKHVKDN